MPQPPEQPRSYEYEGIPYLRHARFTAQDSKPVYNTLQGLARDQTIGGSFSVFRLIQSWSDDFTQNIVDPNKRFVIVLGENIPPQVQNTVDELFSAGDQEAKIPDSILAGMVQKRLNNLGQPYTEIHHTPFKGFQRRNPEKEKIKRKIQKDSRRRNRGK